MTDKLWRSLSPSLGLAAALLLGAMPGARPAAASRDDAFPMLLTGAEQADIQLERLAGPAPAAKGNLVAVGAELARAPDAATERARATQVRGVFAGAAWRLRPDGGFDFTPLPRARSLLSPLAGHYRRRAGEIELHSGGTSDGPWLDGTIREVGGVYLLEALYTAPHVAGVALVRQSLAAGLQRSSPGVMPLPDRFDVVLTAWHGEQALPPRPGVLRLLYPVAGSTAPLALSLETATIPLAGSCFWSADGDAAGDTIAADAGRIEEDFARDLAPLAAGDRAIKDLGRRFWTGPEQEKGGQRSWPQFHVERAHLELSVRGDEITGELRATGVAWGRPARVEYRASLTGHRARLEGPALWEDPQLQAFKVPANPGGIFRIEVSGETEAGKFAPRAGMLSLIPHGADEARLTLLTTARPLGPGHVSWADIKTSYPRPGQEVSVTFEPRDNVEASHSDVEWFSVSDEPGHSFAEVVPSRITLRFTVNPDRSVSGEVEGSGTVVNRHPQPGTYHAVFHGRLETSALGERFERDLADIGARGEWRLEDGAGRPSGKLILERSGAALRGRWVSRGTTVEVRGEEKAGLVTLHRHGGRGDLTLRHVPVDKGLLVGLGSGRLPGAARVLLGERTRMPLPRIHVEDGTKDDADALRHIGEKLWSRSQCGAATVALEGALEIYQRALAQKQVGKLHEPLVHGSLDSVGTYLTACDLQLGDPGRLIEHLTARVNLFRPRRQSDEEAPAVRFEWPIDDVTSLLGSEMENIDSLADQFEKIRLASLRYPAAPPEQDLFQTAQGTCVEELRSVARDLLAADLRIAGLTGEVRARAKSPAAARSEVLRLLWDLGASAERSFRRIAPQGREILARDAGLLADRDRFWAIPWQFATGDPVTWAQRETRLFDVLKSSPRLGPFWGHFFVEQAVAGLQLENLQVHLEGLVGSMDLAVNDPGRTALLHDAVAAADSVAAEPDRWRERLATDATKSKFQNSLEPIFSRLAVLLFDTGALEPALHVAEAARARALMDLLAARLRSAPPAGASGGQGALASDEAVPLLSVDQLRDEVRRRDSTTIEYLAAERQLLIWVVSPSGDIRGFSAAIGRQHLADLAGELERRMEAGDAADCRTGELLRELYTYLIAPIAATALPEDPEKALTIVPSGPLFAVPFAGLVAPDGTPWVARHALVFGASIGALRVAREKAADQPDRQASGMLALVNPRPMPLGERRRRLAPLSAVESQFPLIASFFPAPQRAVLAGPAATKSAFERAAPGAEFLYLTTHARFLGPDASYIALADDRQPDGPYLRPADIAHLDLHSRLTVLWACETGRGEGKSADGIEGLSRAFSVAGSRNLLLSLWSVPEQESLYLMYAFHTFWRSGRLSLAQALRRAQLEYAKNRSARPDLWAAFVLHGDAGER